jgi:thiamine pyrophosphate-dependent acetolactate synthase large subunit-like protein
MMGWGLRAALGAAVADPEVPVIAYVGDGSLHVAGTALSVAAGLRLRVLVVVPENGVLGSARRRHRPGPRDPALLPPLDPVLLAMSCRVPALRCGTAGAVIDGVRGFVSGDGPTLLAVPMPAPGPDESGGPEAVLTGIPVLDGRRT